MTEFNYNQTIEYIDGTRDLNFEAAQKWAREHGTTFEEDMDKREPYEQEHEETYMNPETGADEVKLVKTPTLKRFFVIGSEPVVETPPEQPEPPEPTIEEKNEQIRQQRQSRFALESDPLYFDYVEAQARGYETVEDKKRLWLAKKDEIRNDLPYIEEPVPEEALPE